MASRAEEKKRLKAEREERERQEKEASQKRAKRLRLIVGGAVVVVAAIVAIAVLSGGSEKKAAPGSQAGLDVSPGPWSNNTDGLEERVAPLGLPSLSETAFHIHAQMSVFVNGKKQTIPVNIGIDSEKQFITSLHTHDTRGVVHMEGARPFPFTLGQFFTTWGVKFTPTQLGAYHAGKGLVLETYVNGKKVPNAPNYVMKSHDQVVVGFGEPGSFPKKTNFKFSPNE